MSKQSTPTQLDYAILGLLKQEPSSGYQIRKTFDATALGNYSSSPGTIYPALKRLQLVETHKTADASRERFYLTKTGLATLKEWLLQPISQEDIKRR